MDLSSLRVVPIHKHPEHFKQCCQLINDEWPRSETARMLSIKDSRDALPTSLILLTLDDKLIGHCKLKRLPCITDSCFLESVVISRELRGQKLGTFLMKKTEEYCKDFLKLKMIHLSTKGQEEFYAKLGYEICAPVTIYGGFPAKIELDRTKTENKPPIKNNVQPPSKIDNIPPPPPMPVNIEERETKKSFMCKYL